MVIIEKYLGTGVVGQAIPAPQIADTHRYLAANPSAPEFRLVSGPDAGQTERHQPTVLKREAAGPLGGTIQGASSSISSSGRPTAITS